MFKHFKNGIVIYYIDAVIHHLPKAEKALIASLKNAEKTFVYFCSKSLIPFERLNMISKIYLDLKTALIAFFSCKQNADDHNW